MGYQNRKREDKMLGEMLNSLAVQFVYRPPGEAERKYLEKILMRSPHLLNDKWTINLKDIEGKMDKEVRMKYLKDLVEIYKKRIEENKQRKNNYEFYMVQAMKNFIEYYDKIMEDREKLNDVESSIEEDNDCKQCDDDTKADC